MKSASQRRRRTIPPTGTALSFGLGPFRVPALGADDTSEGRRSWARRAAAVLRNTTAHSSRGAVAHGGPSARPHIPRPVPSRLEPMLATNRQPGDGHTWAIEPKLDGWRTVVNLDGSVRVRTRSGRNVTESLPELAGLAEQVPDGTVLDGEIVADGGRGVDFYKVAPSMMAVRRRRAPLAYVVFDVAHLAGEPTIGLTYRDRRRLLELLELRPAGVVHSAVVRRRGRRGARGVRPVAARGTCRQAGRLPL